MNTIEKLKVWWLLSRPPFHLVGIFPFILGTVIAWREGNFRWSVFLLATLVVILIMLVTYHSGEYYDYETDSINVNYNKFSGGTRILPAGLIPRHHVLIATRIWLFLIAALGLVLYFYYKTGPYTLPLGAFGLLCGYFYTTKPFQWAYRGIGEILIGICYGWLTVNTAYYLQTQHFSLIPTLASIPISISIFLVILINEFPDYQSDKVSGKNNLVVRFGQEKMAILYISLIIACFISIMVGLLYGIPWLVASLSILPLFLIVLNIRAIWGGGFRQARVLEGLCARTTFINWLLAGIYIIAFLAL